MVGGSHFHIIICRGMCIDARKCIHLCISYMQKLELFVYMMFWFLGHVDYYIKHYFIIWSDFAGELQHSFSLPQSTVISSISHHPSLHLLAVSSLSYHHPVSLLTHHQWLSHLLGSLLAQTYCACALCSILLCFCRPLWHHSVCFSTHQTSSDSLIFHKCR